MKPQIKQALQVLAAYTAILKLTKDEHLKIQNALDLIETEIVALSPQPETPKESIDKDKSLA